MLIHSLFGTLYNASLPLATYQTIHPQNLRTAPRLPISINFTGELERAGPLAPAPAKP
jgi:hypothetical protein